MRLSPHEQNVIRAASVGAFDAGVSVWPFASRTDYTKRGGDIDLLIQPAPTATNHLFSRIMNVDGCKDSYTELDTVSVGTARQQEEIVPVEFTLINQEKDADEELSAKQQKAYWIAKKILLMKKKSFMTRL